MGNKNFWAAVAAGFAVPATAGAQAVSPVLRYQPDINIKEDPGCGKMLKSKDERVAHNRKLAELYFVNFQKDRENGRNYSWWTWGCVAPTATVLLGTVAPLGVPRTLGGPGSAAPTKDTLSGEQRGYFATFPDWRTQPGTLAVVPFDGGAYFRMMYGGHGKDDGKLYTIWETNLILVNSLGQITHFEMWNDSIGMDATTRKAFGTGLADLLAGTKSYGAVTESFPKE